MCITSNAQCNHNGSPLRRSFELNTYCSLIFKHCYNCTLNNLGTTKYSIGTLQQIGTKIERQHDRNTKLRNCDQEI